MIVSQLYVGLENQLRFTGWNFCSALENNEESGKLRANHFLILTPFLCTGGKNVFHNNKTNAAQRWFETIEY